MTIDNVFRPLINVRFLVMHIVVLLSLKFQKYYYANYDTYIVTIEVHKQVKLVFCTMPLKKILTL